MRTAPPQCDVDCLRLIFFRPVLHRGKDLPIGIGADFVQEGRGKFIQWLMGLHQLHRLACLDRAQAHAFGRELFEVRIGLDEVIARPRMARESRRKGFGSHCRLTAQLAPNIQRRGGASVFEVLADATEFGDRKREQSADLLF